MLRDEEVVRRLMREADAARVTPPAALRRRTIAALQADPGRTRAPRWALAGAYARACGLVVVLAVAAVVVVRTLPVSRTTPEPTPTTILDLRLENLMGLGDAPVRAEASLRNEAQLIVNDARIAQQLLVSRVEWVFPREP